MRSVRFHYRDALGHRGFRALFAAQLISIGGTTVAAVALTVLVYDRSRSPLLASLTFALGFLPYLLGGLVSGLAERIAPRRLVVGANLLAAAAAAAMAWPGAPIALLLGLVVVVGMLSSLASGSGAALLRGAVPADAYVPARSLLRIVSQLAQIGGNAAGGALLVVLTPSDAMLVNAASFAFAAALVRLRVDDLPLRARQTGPLLRDSLHGLRTIFAHRELRRLLLLGWLVSTFTVAPEALAAPYVSGLGDSRTFVGIWLVALPVGTVAGDLIGIWLVSPRWQSRLIAPAAAAAFVPYLAFAAHPPLELALPLLAVAGSCSLYALGLDQRLRDLTTPESFARVMAVNSAGMMTLQGLGFALAGGIAQLVGAPRAILVAGVCGLAVAALFGPWRGAQPMTTVRSSRVSA